MWHGLPAHENTAKMAVPRFGFVWVCFGFVFVLILDNILRDTEGVR